MLTALFAASGASCPPRLWRPQHEPTPIAFQTRPTLEQIIDYVNSGTSRVNQLQTTGAWLSTDGMVVSLRANIALERPKRFRLQAGMAGPEIDIGSNDEVFWFWAKRGDPAAIYFCRHDQFQYAAARQVLPVQPDWIAEALGLVYFDPTLDHRGPFPRGADQLEIHSIIPSPEGNLTKVTVLDAQHAWVLQQQIYDSRKQLLASAIASRHRYDPIAGVSLPRQVDIQLPPAQLSFRIQVVDYLVNQLSSNPQQLWSMPQIEGYPLIDLAGPSVSPAVSRIPNSQLPHSTGPYPSPSPRPYPAPQYPPARHSPTQYPPQRHPSSYSPSPRTDSSYTARGERPLNLPGNAQVQSSYRGPSNDPYGSYGRGQQ
jgi:hypothetical protein